MILQKNDPYRKPSFSLMNRIKRQLWNTVWLFLFRPSPKLFHVWRIVLLKLFGAKIGKGCRIHSTAKIWAPWNLICADVVAIADEVIIYNPSLVTLGSHCIVSQQAYLCGAAHDYNDSSFPLISAPIKLEAYSWVCARATVQMGVTFSEGAILGLNGVATKNLEPWTVYGGIPAKKIKARKCHHDEYQSEN